MTQVTPITGRPAPADVVETLEDRCATLNFLAQMYQGEPRPDVLAPLLDALAQPLPPNVEDSRGQALLRAFAAQSAGTQVADVAAGLSAEYVAMFFSSWRRVVAPFESVYTSDNHVMLQEAASELARLYAEEGLQPDGHFTEPADHIALELAFMAHLCGQTLAAAQRGETEGALSSLARQTRFLEDHLLAWVPAFCRDLAETTRSDFYRGIAWLTLEFLQTEAPTLAELTQTLKAPAAGKERGA